MVDIVGVLLAGIAAGALNAIGGGGTFVAFPALVAVGLPPVSANAASTVALLPGALASAWTYRADLIRVGRLSPALLTTTSLLGGAVGAGLLLVLPAASFDAAVPWLLAFATLVLAFGRRLCRLLASTMGRPVAMSTHTLAAAQFVVAVYGGYFGGAVGILMLAVWSVGLGIDPVAANPTRVAQMAATFTAAAVFFLVASDATSHPRPVLTMLVGAIVGGVAGAHIAKRLSTSILRGTVLATATTMTILYFVASST